jgi:sporulation protein YlmC with PRC-barrel domain
MAGRPVIESDRVEGTYVYDRDDNHIGTIKRLMIEKVSGHVSSAVISFGGFFGLGEHEYSIPWDKLQYDVNLAGYRTDITEQDLKAGKYS